MKILLSTISLILLSTCIMTPAFSEEIALKSMGGVYTVPVRLNNSLTMEFTIDTGAADVSLSEGTTNKLISTGVMAECDFKGSETYTIADGSSVKCRTLVLRNVRIGEREVSDVKASACPGNPPLLLGQTFLKKLGAWAMDYNRNAVVPAKTGFYVLSLRSPADALSSNLKVYESALASFRPTLR